MKRWLAVGLWGISGAIVSLASWSGSALAADVTEQEPGAKAAGKVHEWKSADGVAFQYFIPESYDVEKGGNLTLVLHGSNLDKRWGFANHPAGTFRPDDVVVCPDGTTSNGQGGFNFLQSGKDLKRFQALHEELIERLNVKATYLYGHSQGSFFAFLYAGAAPELVHGVVGHASGVWAGTYAGKKGHHQAIVLMHGTADPVVPYAQSEACLATYTDAKYPHARLRSLQGWNHWPAEVNGSIGGQAIPHTSQQLAWVEGITSSDPARVGVCFDVLADTKLSDWHDFAALYDLAGRVASMEGMDEKRRARATKARTAVEELAQRHVDALTKDLDKADGKTLEDEAWVVHLPAFLRDFAGVPACEELRAAWEKRLDAQRTAAVKHLRKYYGDRQKKPAAALDSGVTALEQGFLHHECQDWNLFEGLAAIRKSAGKDVNKKVAKRHDEVVKALRTCLEKGHAAYAKVNRSFELR